MILIAHRGNTNGPNPEQENHPDYVMSALKQGYDVEIDLWRVGKDYMLGHDEPQHYVFGHFLLQRGLWVHCKDYATFQHMIETEINCFYHTDENYVLTNHSWIWAYPGQPGGFRTICVMPEYYDTPVEGFAGVCSDYVEKYKND